METTGCNEIDQTAEFLTAPQLVSLRKPDEESIRCVVGEKYYTRSGTWLENKAVECALESFNEALRQKRAARKCDLMQAEWNEELNASITSKLKGKFVQHMGRAWNGKIALTPEESLFLLENGSIEISNNKTPLSTEEAYKVMLKENLSAEKYQVYSQLSQLGFIVVPHQSELGVTKYEKRMNLDKHQLKRKRKTVSDVYGAPEKKRLTFLGAFSNKSELAVSSTNHEDSSVLMTTEPVIQHKPNAMEPISESVLNCQPDKPLAPSTEDVVKDLENGALIEERKEQVLEDSACNAADSAAAVNKLEDSNEVSTTAIDTIAESHNSNDETVLQTLPADTPNEISAPVSCTKFSENGKGFDVEVEAVEVGINEEMPVQQEVDSASHFDTNSNLVPENYELDAASGLSKNSIDVMNIDSENTEISCTSEVTKSNSKVPNSNVNVTLEDSSCSVMDAVAHPNDQDSNSDVMSCSSDNDDVLSYDVGSDCDLSANSQDDDEIELLEVTKKEIKPLAVIDLLSDEELNSDLSGSDDEIQVLKVCNGVSNKKPHNVDSVLRNPSRCKKEEPGSTSNHRNNVRQLSFPNCTQKEMVCVARPAAKYLPRNVCLSKEAYILNFKSKSEQPTGRVWNSYKDMREYQLSRQHNRRPDRPFPSFHNRDSSRRADLSSRDARQSFSQRRTASNENDQPRWADNVPRRDVRLGSNHRLNDPHDTHQFDLPSNRDVKRSFNHRGSDSPEVFTTHLNPERSIWLDRNPGGPLREDGPNFISNRSGDSTEGFPNAHSFNHTTNPFNSSRNVNQSPYRYPVPNASAAINSVVSVSNQDMNVSMVGNHILHPPLHSSSPHLPSFNANLPSLAAIGPVDIMAEVQRTAYTVATSMLSSMFGQNMNPVVMPHLPPFNAFQPAPPVQNSSPFGFPPQLNSVFNAQNFSSEQFSMQNRHPVREPPRRQHHGNPFPCQYRNLRTRTNWNDVKEAIGDEEDDESSLDVGSDVEEVPINPTDILWDPKNISPLVKPGIKYPIPDVFKKLQVTHTANIIGKSLSNKVYFSTTCSIEISFDVYLPGTNYKKTCPDIPKHRIIVVRSTDPIPKYSDIAFLQSKWNDGATLQVAVVDNGDISYQSFNSVCLPVLTPDEK